MEITAAIPGVIRRVGAAIAVLALIGAGCAQAPPLPVPTPTTIGAESQPVFIEFYSDG